MFQSIRCFAIAAFVLFFIVSISCFAQPYLGSPGFSAGRASFVALAVDPSGTPYVAYQDSVNGQKITVKKYNAPGNNWQTVGSVGFSAGRADYTCIAIDPSGIPYVAYSDFGNAQKAIVKKYNGTAWVDVGTGGVSLYPAYYLSFAIDGSGKPYLAYEDNGGGKVTVRKFDGAGWAAVGSPEFSAAQAYWISLAIDRHGTPYVAYRDVFINRATVRKYDGSGWIAVGDTAVSDSAVYGAISLAIAPNDTPYIVFSDISHGYTPDGKKFDGTSWININNYWAWDAGHYVSLDISPSGLPWFAYCGFNDGPSIIAYDTVFKEWSPFVQHSWEFQFCEYSVLKTAGDTALYLAYQDITHGRRISVERLSFVPVSTSVSAFQGTGVSIHPNPSHGSFVASMPSPASAPVTIIVTDALGTKVKELTTKTNTDTRIHLDVSPGIYFLTAVGNGQCQYAKVLVQ